MNYQLVLGVGNKARHGKDTFAEAIVDYYKDRLLTSSKHSWDVFAPKVQRIGFADALYEVARNEYGMTTKDAPLLQRVGAERRQGNPNYWIGRAFAKIDPDSHIIIFPDTRYQNEADFIKNVGGFTVNVSRVNPDGTPFVAGDRPADHPSEIDLDGYNWDFYLKIKTGDVALLAQQAITLVEYLRGLRN